MDWSVEGSYLESCNCEAICPCRRISGVAGGRSTYGVCFGVLSWAIDSGHADDVDLSGLAVAIVYWYDDDVVGSPWELVLYVDERADEFQHECLAQIFTGRAGGPHLLTLPWIRKPSELHEVRSSPIEILPGESVRIGELAEVVVGHALATNQTVTCIVPGHDRLGAEHYADRLTVDDPPFVWDLKDNCAYVAPFSYASN